MTVVSYLFQHIETVSPEGAFCDTVQVPSCAGDMRHPVLFLAIAQRP